MDPFTTDQNKGNEQQGDFQIDAKRILFKVIHYWYWVVLSLSISLLGAFFINRYSEKIYSVNSSIIISEKNEASAGILYSNPLNNFRRKLPKRTIHYPLLSTHCRCRRAIEL